jgi:methylamine dehydrogenase accessory protein MauD
MTALIVANAFAWVAIAALAVTVLALARQVGLLHERMAPMGALTMDSGPKAGSPAPAFAIRDLNQGTVSIGSVSGRTQLLFFLSPTCPVCKKLLPILRAIAADEHGTTDVVLASDGPADEHLAFYRREKLDPFRYVLSSELGMTYHIGRLPYAVVIGPDGRIAAKGLVNNREQIESLLVAQELGVGSLQDYLSRGSAGLQKTDAHERHDDVAVG